MAVVSGSANPWGSANGPAVRGLINSAIGLTEAKNLWYNGQELWLDGYSFQSCRFDKCTLNVNSPNFELVNCMISNDSLVIFQNHTGNLIKLYTRVFVDAEKSFLGFYPEKNSDGTISIRRG